ncbi:hypothetical protein HDV57DRAFT_297311 [Trichoderma longibrachiatum]
MPTRYTGVILILGSHLHSKRGPLRGSKVFRKPYSSALAASSVAPSALAAFFLGLLFFFPVFLARGCSRILRISSSVIFLSVWNLLRSSSGAAPSLVMPFLVMAVALSR